MVWIEQAQEALQDVEALRRDGETNDQTSAELAKSLDRIIAGQWSDADLDAWRRGDDFRIAGWPWRHTAGGIVRLTGGDPGRISWVGITRNIAGVEGTSSMEEWRSLAPVERNLATKLERRYMRWAERDP